MAITEAIGDCALEAGLLLQIKNKTNSALNKLLFYSKAKYYKFRKKEKYGPLILSNFNDPKWRTDEFREKRGVKSNDVWLRLIKNAKSPRQASCGSVVSFPRRSWTDGLSPRQKFISDWLSLTNQSHHAINTSQSHSDFWEQSRSQDLELGPPNVKAVIFFS
jgi:hypothetical protein